MAEVMASVLATFPQAKWHQYDPISSDGARAAALAEGAGGDAIYHFDKADVVVTLDADFLTCGPGSVRYQKDFATHRRITEERKEMSRLYAIESTPTLTGAKADHRLAMKASDGRGFRPSACRSGGRSRTRRSSVRCYRSGKRDRKWLAAIAKDLQAHRGVRWSSPANTSRRRFTRSRARSIRRLVMWDRPSPTARRSRRHHRSHCVINRSRASDGCGPGGCARHAWRAQPGLLRSVDLKFAEKLKKVNLSVYHGLYVDETASLCQWNVPDAHPLESWGDSRSFDGTVTITQPLIAPLYDGHSAVEVLATLTSQPDRRGHVILKDYWTRAFAVGPWTIRSGDGQPFKNFDAFWRRTLHDGFINGTAVADGGPATPFGVMAVPAAVPITTALPGCVPIKRQPAPHRPQPPLRSCDTAAGRQRLRRRRRHRRTGWTRTDLPARSDGLGRSLLE
jgi:molybdopterin-containing oxidoreductase family iron-sulfur binding subunit